MNGGVQLRVHQPGRGLAETVYHRRWARQVVPAQRRLLELAAVQPGERVLDVACGTGAVTIPAAWAAGPGGYVLGTDSSEAMVRHTAEEARREGIGWIDTRRTEAGSPPDSAGAFDAALCSLGLAHVPDPVQALAAMARALRPGGRAVAAVWGAPENCGWAGVFPVVARWAGARVGPGSHQLGTGDALMDAFSRAGFASVRVERIATTLRYASATAALGAVFLAGPVGPDYSTFDSVTAAGARAEYLASIEPFRRGPGYAIPAEFAVALGFVGPAGRRDQIS